jgi:hypothetical protein
MQLGFSLKNTRSAEIIIPSAKDRWSSEKIKMSAVSERK